MYKIIDVEYAFSGGTFATGDVIASGLEIPQAVRGPNCHGYLNQLTLTDTTDTGAALTLVLFDRFISFAPGDGTPIGLLLTLTQSAYAAGGAGAPTILDADAKAGILFGVSIASGDYVDVGGAKFATANVGRVVRGDEAGSVWGAVVAGGAITLTPGALKLRFGFDQET